MDSGVLSGFVAGPPDSRDIPNGGPKIRELEDAWCDRYNVKHALTFNSATSGLYAACAAADVQHGDHVITTPWTMSATVAAPLALGATVDFADIEDETYCINPDKVRRAHQITHRDYGVTKAVIAVNLFGHPAKLSELREICDDNGMILIEDAAQTPLAMEYGRISGTVGDLGVYSLNRHKHIHCGEGGVVVTNSDELAARVRSVRNHGIHPLGLNLRMTELEAAIALVQLNNITEHVNNRRMFGKVMSETLKNVIDVPFARDGCEHDFYMWVAKMDASTLDVPHIKGYIQPLHNIFMGGQRDCPMVEKMRNEIVCFETCKYDPTADQLATLMERFDEAVR